LLSLKLTRLEAATSRLEDLTVYHAAALSKASGNTELKPSKSVTNETPPQLDSGSEAEPSSGGAILPAPVGTSDATANPSIVGFDELLVISREFLAFSQGIDPLIEEQVTHLVKALETTKDILKISLKAVKPDLQSSEFAELVKPIQRHADFIIELREKNRGFKFVNHLSTVAEGIPALGWILVEEPNQYIADFKDSAQFYSNRILKEFKESDKKQVTWVQEFSKLLVQLQGYVKKFYPQGLSWNAEGKPLAEVLANTSKETPGAPELAPASSGPPPPPPPMPPSSVFKVEQTAAPTTSGGINAVFGELNKGESVTAGLKKVEKSQMTHKNPELRAKKATPPPPKKPSNLAGSKATGSSVKKKPARKELQDTKWIIENFESEHDIVIHTEMNQGVFIDHCNNCTIQIKGKASAVSINECNKTGVLVENLVSGVDIIKSTGFGLQVTGVIPTLSVDQSNDGQIYLSKESLDIKVYTAQSSSLNINLPKSQDEYDYNETPLPEQLLHRIENGKLVSTIVEYDG
jgi:adenylyl cyclase-associated protein